MRDGRVEQAGSPEEVYARPATRWVAEFLGAAEVLPGTADQGVVTTELLPMVGDEGHRGAVEVVVRPEAVALAQVGDAGVPAGAVPAWVVDRSFFGPDQVVRVRLASGRVVRSRGRGTVSWVEGEEVRTWVEGPVQVLEPVPPP